MEAEAAPQRVKRVWRTVLPLVTLDDSDGDDGGGFGWAANNRSNGITSQPRNVTNRPPARTSRAAPASARATAAAAPPPPPQQEATTARSADHTPTDGADPFDVHRSRRLNGAGAGSRQTLSRHCPPPAMSSNERRGEQLTPSSSASASPLPRNVAEMRVYEKQSEEDEATTTVTPFVVVCSPGCGQLFECMRDFLESRRGDCWKDGGDALLAFVTGSSALPAVRPTPQQRIPSAAPRRSGSASSVCCDRLAVVNLFLSDKSTAERLCEESRLFQARELRAESRNSAGYLPPPPTHCAAGCAHQREVERSVASNRFPYVAKPPLTLCSYIEGFRCITLKSRMVKTLLAYHGGSWRLLGAYLPLTFQVTPRAGSCGSRQRDEREILVETMCECNVAEFQRTGEIATYWIAKSSHGAHGSNIRIFFADQRGLDTLIQFIDGQTEPYPWVVSRYIDRPLLYRGRKFDVRCWVLVAPNLSVYLHRELVMRTSSELYNRENLTTDNAHGRLANITNHCVQAEGRGYSLHEEGNELWRDTLDELIRSTYRGMSREAQQRNVVLKKYLHLRQQPNTNGSRNPSSVSKSGGSDENSGASNCATLSQCILPQIREIVVNCTLAAQAQIPRPVAGGDCGDTAEYGAAEAVPPSTNPHLRLRRRHVTQSFQVMGYDFIIDENFVVWLLEVNGSPGVAQKLLPDIVRDTVEILIDPLFPGHHIGDSATPTEGGHRRNGFELIHRGK